MDPGALIRGLRELAGHVEDGSSQAVTISQDDATRDWVVSVNRNYYASARTFEQAIDAAITKNTNPST